MAWVSPLAWEELYERQEAVRLAQEAGLWDLAALQALAERWQVDYLLIQGRHAPPRREAVWFAGPYSIFLIPEPPSPR